MGWLLSILTIIGKALGIAKDVQEEKNTPGMVANKEAATHSAEADQINQQVADAQAADPKTAQKAQAEIRREFGEG